jgi:hypothetical protein
MLFFAMDSLPGMGEFYDKKQFVDPDPGGQKLPTKTEKS